MFDKEKATQALLYIVSRYGHAGKHKVFKSMYFAEQQHMARYGAPLLGDRFIAMNYGPVPTRVYDFVQTIGQNFSSNTNAEVPESLFSRQGHMLQALAEPNMDYLAETEIECLDEAIAKCKDLEFGELSRISHDNAWQQAPANGPMSPIAIAAAGGADRLTLAYLNDVLANELEFV